ncbi:hypothetical protein DY000_02006637 [Brassica cretica]|uniref:Uncharacterized protein n=1 Tax=Brassica cretica TaxID=69181 RepID=A0ABQ7CEU2_BRACR|nr:hypothetical protein DY000_02006637 [Brassica cretica]
MVVITHHHAFAHPPKASKATSSPIMANVDLPPLDRKKSQTSSPTISPAKHDRHCCDRPD